MTMKRTRSLRLRLHGMMAVAELSAARVDANHSVAVVVTVVAIPIHRVRRVGIGATAVEIMAVEGMVTAGAMTANAGKAVAVTGMIRLAVTHQAVLAVADVVDVVAGIARSAAVRAAGMQAKSCRRIRLRRS